MDFYRIVQNTMKNGSVELYPDFIVSNRYKDLMIKGRAFYAIWDEENNVWSTNECRVAEIIDKDLEREAENLRKIFEGKIVIRKMQSYHSTIWKTWKNYISSIPDNFHQLDMNVLFANHELKRNDYASRKLSYPLMKGNCDNYKELMSTLYEIEERRKIEWAIGAIVAGDAKYIQKFMVLYGDAGAGKSTVLNIIEQLFDGYCSTFDAKALTTNNNTFATEVFRNNPLIAIQHDGDLSRIEDNTKLNSIVSHENIMIHEKYKSSYPMKMSCFLFMASNNPVKITNAKSGIIRRLIDVHPSGNKVSEKRYFEIMDRIPFELGAIANHCLNVYTKCGKNYYASYKPIDMMYKTDPFFNFVEDRFIIFDHENGVASKVAYKMYLDYCEESHARYTLSFTEFREELKNYFEKYISSYTLPSGEVIRGYYSGFIRDKFNISTEEKVEEEKPCNLVLDSSKSVLDKEFSNFPAQYTTDDGRPKNKWANVTTTLSDLDTTKLHYINVSDVKHIFIDFDLKDENGNKSYVKNLEAASKWPPTYAELSKSGCGIHLHYIYDGDTSALSHYYDENIEVKTFNGNSALRRQLTKCNNLPIAHISSGLPLKGDTKMVNFEGLKNEKAIRTMLLRNMNKEYHDATKPSVDYIYKILEDAYNSGIPYDVSDMKSAVFAFAASSTNQSDYCTKLVLQMKWKSEEPNVNKEYESPIDKLVFYDIEVFPNVIIICWKIEGHDKVNVMFNPTPSEAEHLLRYKLVGHNVRKYDNHILHSIIIGYSVYDVYRLSQDIINNQKGFFREAYNYSYTDTYDYASAPNKKGLKKWEIELGLPHVENEYPWDKPLPEDKWQEVADYCCNDVISTEALHNHLSGDWLARQILAKWAGMTCNDTTNNLSTKIIFGSDKHPQSQFNYRDLSKPVRPETIDFSRYHKDKIWRVFDENGEPTYTTWDGSMTLPFGYSIMPFFPGYKFEEFGRHSSYRDVDKVGEGGYVYSEPGMHGPTETLDVASEHPSSIDEEELFGPVYTEKFRMLKRARLAIKHGDFELAKKNLPEIVHEYLNDPSTAKGLAGALKTVINAIYGLTAATFDCSFKDPRNKDNIVAKRGSLFMINLRIAVQKKGFQVLHCKTDSIKIVNPTSEIEEFIYAYGREYGYEFEIEHKFDRICLVDKANYIAKLADDDPEDPGKWTATGDKFARPFIFKTMFSKEEITLDDLREVKSVKTSLYLDFNEGLDKEEHKYRFVGRVGEFVPVKEGTGGALLMRVSGENEDGSLKYAAAEGTKGWRWKELKVVEANNLKDTINMDYYRAMVDDAIDTLNEIGNGNTADEFCSDEPFCELPFK